MVTGLAGCSHDEKIEGLKSNEILVVTLEIADDIDVEEIRLIAKEGTDLVKGDKIRNRRKIKLKVPYKGEGTFTICVYTKTGVICSLESYAEGGYRPGLKLANNRFETVKWF